MTKLGEVLHRLKDSEAFRSDEGSDIEEALRNYVHDRISRLAGEITCPQCNHRITYKDLTLARIVAEEYEEIRKNLHEEEQTPTPQEDDELFTLLGVTPQNMRVVLPEAVIGDNEPLQNAILRRLFPARPTSFFRDLVDRCFRWLRRCFGSLTARCCCRAFFLSRPFLLPPLSPRAPRAPRE